MVEEAVFVADYDEIGPGGSGGDQETQVFNAGVGRDIEGELGGVGLGGLERREERRAFGGYGRVLVAGGVDKRDDARARS